VKKFSTYINYTKKVSFIFISLSPFLLVCTSLFLFSFHQSNKIPTTNKSFLPNIVLITLDTTRADHLGCYGYSKNTSPNIDKLAKNGILFRHAFTPVPLTLPSHCSILTGMYPSTHNVHNNGLYQLNQNFFTLPEVLKEKGYQTAAFISSFTLDSRFGLDQGFDYYDDQFNQNEALKNYRSERNAAEVYNAFLKWFQQRSSEKFFCWIHFFDPHLPYNPPSPYKEKFSGHPYDGEIAYMDFYVGQIIKVLKKENLLKKTVLILVGDHGEALGDKREIDHGLFLYNSTLKVPLIIFTLGDFLPHKITITTRIRTIDIFPTITEICKIDSISFSIHGQSLLPLLETEKNTDRSCYLETYFPYENFGWARLTGFIQGKWKFINAPQPELYHLQKDPGETNNLADKQPERVKAIKNSLAKYLPLSSTKTNLPALSKIEERKLRSLGYIATQSPRKRNQKLVLPDPKDKIEDYLLFYKGNLYENSGKFNQAIRCYQEVIRRNPQVANHYVTLGYLYMKMNKFTQATKLLEEAQKVIPNSPIILSRLIFFHSRAQNFDRALYYCHKLLQIDPDNFDALFLAGSISAKKGKWFKALEFYQKALYIEPENKILRMRYAYTLAALGKETASLREYQQLLKKYPNDYQLLKEIGEVYNLLGHTQKAIEYLHRSLIFKLDPDVCFLYASLQAKGGHFQEAIKWMKIFLKIGKDKSPAKLKEAKKLIQNWQIKLKK